VFLAVLRAGEAPPLDGSTPLTSPSMSMPVGRPKPSCDRKRAVSSMSVSDATW